MKEVTKRSIFRWIHIIGGVPILGYIYDSPTDTPNYAWSVRVCLSPRIADFRIVDVEAMSFYDSFRKPDPSKAF